MSSLIRTIFTRCLGKLFSVIVQVLQMRSGLLQFSQRPVNVMRLDKKSPCGKTGRCENCSSPDRICNTWTMIEKCFPKHRVKVVLINEDMGF